MPNVRTETSARTVRDSACYNCGRRRSLEEAAGISLTFSCPSCKSDVGSVLHAFFGWPEEASAERDVQSNDLPARTDAEAPRQNALG
jgi:hypothetical protein